MVACWPRQGAVHPRHAITCVKDGRRARLPGDAALAGDADWPRRCETPGFFITVYERLSSASCVDARATHGRSLSLGHFRGLGFGLGVWAVWCTVTTQRLPSVSSSCNTSLPSAAISTEDIHDAASCGDRVVKTRVYSGARTSVRPGWKPGCVSTNLTGFRAPACPLGKSGSQE